ncbi:MAG TPA: hypothetical protein VE401_08385 [Solirubrobacterales bacterium]|jgi:hypothetical protein|nr:hypothetical protein [Solirubrobacterales bacterium]HZA90238.1 hypothetical protein [Solirubrobacterales bacterium]
MSDVSWHEAAHAAATVWLRRPIAWVERYPGHFLPGETMGHCRAPIDDEVEPSQLAIALSGYLAEDRDGWPPAFQEARTERLEALGKVIEILGIDEAAYDRAVELTREILADPDFIRLHRTIARALAACPRLDEQAVQDLTLAAGIPPPEGVTTP